MWYKSDIPITTCIIQCKGRVKIASKHGLITCFKDHSDDDCQDKFFRDQIYDVSWEKRWAHIINDDAPIDCHNQWISFLCPTRKITNWSWIYWEMEQLTTIITSVNWMSFGEESRQQTDTEGCPDRWAKGWLDGRTDGSPVGRTEHYGSEQPDFETSFTFPWATMVENRKERRCKYGAPRSSVRSFARTAHSFTR